MAEKELAKRFWPKVDRRGPDECWPWMAYRDRNGYGRISVGGRAGRTELAHRLAWTLANGPIPASLCVLHRCDNPSCVRPEHLFLGTQHENLLDMVAKRRHVNARHPELLARGERHGSWTHPERLRRGSMCAQAKLKEDDVLFIRERYREGGISTRQLARAFGVSQPAIRAVLRRETWRHVRVD